MRTVPVLLMFAIVIATVGAMGCSDTKPSPRTAARIRHLEARNTRLEEDYQATVEECVALRRQLVQTRKQYQTIQQRFRGQTDELQTASKERDEFKAQLDVCSGQRDSLQSELTRFSRDLQNLAGKVQQIATRRSSGVPASTVSMTREK